MKKVWKCDHCSHTQEKIFGMLEHEKNCSFNELNKKCFTCDHSREDGYECDLGLDTSKGEKKGNCSGWKNLEWLKNNRKEKLERILISK